MSFIKKLQNKPRYIRVQVLWISVILIMSIIVFIWLIFLNYSLKNSESKQKSLEAKHSTPSLFGTLKEDFSFFKKNLQAGVRKIIESSNKETEFEVEIIK